ncbi:MAG: hypothetical protein HC913_22360 [Microscillaceae bacterium]|nr:hypothetical protein [Microscillaceae bacterium]
MNQSKSKLEAFLELCVGLLQDTQAEEEWIEYTLLFLKEAKYSPALPAIFKRFADYEAQNWASGWGMRTTFYRTLQQIGGEMVHQFLCEKQAMETEASLQKDLEAYLNASKINNWYENPQILDYENEMAVPDFAFCQSTDSADIAFFYLKPLTEEWKTFRFNYFGGTKVSIRYRTEADKLIFACHLPAEQIPSDFSTEDIAENTYFRVSFWFGSLKEMESPPKPPYFTEKYSLWEVYEKHFEISLQSIEIFGFYTCNWELE